MIPKKAQHQPSRRAHPERSKEPSDPVEEQIRGSDDVHDRLGGDGSPVGGLFREIVGDPDEIHSPDMIRALTICCHTNKVRPLTTRQASRGRKVIGMAKAIVAHHVADYDRWYPVFIEHGEVRRKHGGRGHVVHRGVEDPNALLVVNDFGTMEGARAFMADPSLAEAMRKAGVDSEPTIYLVEETEDAQY